MTHFRRRFLGAGVLIALLVGCAAERLHHEGMDAFDRGEYEIAVDKISQAVQRDPENVAYRLDLRSRRDQAVQVLIAQADTARHAGDLDSAALLYRRVLMIDPADNQALRGLAGLDADRRHAVLVSDAHKDFERKDLDAADAKLRVVLNENPGYAPAQELANAINTARGPRTVAPRLKTRDNRKVTLQLRDAPTKMVFEVLQRETGINFILDKEIKSDSKTTIFVQDVPVEEAIDLVLDQNQLTRQILADNMVLIYPNTQAKQKDYQEEMVRTFYVTNAAPKDVESLLKAVLGTKTLYVDERSNAVVMRDTPDAVRMAEKLVASVDIPEPEVMLEVEVLEISRSHLQDLGIQYPTSATLTPTPLSAGTATGGTSGLTLYDLLHQNSHTVTVTPLSVTLNALEQKGVVSTLASPRIRARNKEKAKVLIGSREPVITNTVTPTAAGTSVVTGSVQYLDVGLTLEVQPTVYMDNDVSIKLNLEVSSILKQVTTTSGTIAYEIGTRNASTLLRLADGETQILGGLIQDTDTRTANTIPGLGDIPILGRLFGTTHGDQEKDEIVLAITPRIIRAQSRAASDATEFWYGTETRTRTAPYSAAGPAGETAPSGAAAPSPSAFPVTPSNVLTPFNPPSGSPPPQPPVTAPEEAPQAAPTQPPPTTVPQSSTSPPQPPPAAVPAPSAATGLAPQAAPMRRAEATVPAGLPLRAPPAPIAPAAVAASPAVGAPANPGAAAGGPAPSALSLEGPTDLKVGDEFDVSVNLATAQSITRLRAQLRFDASALQLVSAAAGGIVPATVTQPRVDAKAGGAQLEIITTPADPVHGSGSLLQAHFKAIAPRNSTEIAAMLNVLGGVGVAVGTASASPLNVAIQPAAQ